MSGLAIPLVWAPAAAGKSKVPKLIARAALRWSRLRLFFIRKRCHRPAPQLSKRCKKYAKGVFGLVSNQGPQRQSRGQWFANQTLTFELRASDTIKRRMLSLPEILNSGGLVLSLILLISAVAVLVFIERFLHCHRAQINSIEFLNGVRTVLKR